MIAAILAIAAWAALVVAATIKWDRRLCREIDARHAEFND